MKKKRDVTPEEFIKAWQTSSSVGEAAEKAGVTRGSAATRASIYRQKGIKLKKMQAGGSRSLSRGQLKGLAKLAKSLEK